VVVSVMARASPGTDVLAEGRKRGHEEGGPARDCPLGCAKGSTGLARKFFRAGWAQGAPWVECPSWRAYANLGRGVHAGVLRGAGAAARAPASAQEVA